VEGGNYSDGTFTWILKCMKRDNTKIYKTSIYGKEKERRGEMWVECGWNVETVFMTAHI